MAFFNHPHRHALQRAAPACSTFLAGGRLALELIAWN
jgi:hypothetical protein